MPPRVVAEGLGSRAAGSVPEEMLEALVASTEQEEAALERSAQTGIAPDGTPEVEMAVRKVWATAAMDSTPPSVVAEGLGRSAPTMARAVGVAAAPVVGPA